MNETVLEKRASMTLRKIIFNPRIVQNVEINLYVTFIDILIFWLSYFTAFFQSTSFFFQKIVENILTSLVYYYYCVAQSINQTNIDLCLEGKKLKKYLVYKINEITFYTGC